MVSTVTPFETLPRQNQYGFISKSFALDWYIFTLIVTSFLDLVVLIEYLASLLLVASSNLSVEPSARTKISFFFFFHACKNYYQLEMAFENENCEQASNPIQWLLSPYLSGSAFLVNFTVPHNQSPIATCVLNLLTMYLVWKQYINLPHLYE